MNGFKFMIRTLEREQFSETPRIFLSHHSVLQMLLIEQLNNITCFLDKTSFQILTDL